LKKDEERTRKMCSLKDTTEEKGTYHALLCTYMITFKAIAIAVVFKLSELAIGV